MGKNAVKVHFWDKAKKLPELTSNFNYAFAPREAKTELMCRTGNVVYHHYGSEINMWIHMRVKWGELGVQGRIHIERNKKTVQNLNFQLNG